MKTIVAATDFSTAGNRAVLRAAAIAAHAEGRLHIFHAASFRIEPEHVAHFAALVEGYFDTLRARIQCRFGTAIEVTGTDASAWQEIYDVLSRQEADLLVVGPHVHPNGIDTFHGTFVEQLVADCRVPVLVAGSDPEVPYRVSLATIDQGQASRDAMPFIRDVAPNAAIELMRIEPDDAPPRLSPDQGAGAVERFRDQAGLGMETRLVMARGDPRSRIREQVSAQKIDLVALTGAEPMNGLQTGFLRAPPCDLLVFPTVTDGKPTRKASPADSVI